MPLGLIDRADRALFAAINRAHVPLLDHTLPRISRAADFSRLWMAASGLLLAAGGDAGRRAAGRGWVSIGVTALIVNVPLKPVFRRRRPELDAVPALRVLRRYPRSASFPSGHAASAATFTTAVAIDVPRAGAALAPLAVAVGLSRVYTGAHYPSDVIAGAAIGWAVAQATRRYVRPYSSEYLEDRYDRYGSGSSGPPTARSSSSAGGSLRP